MAAHSNVIPLKPEFQVATEPPEATEPAQLHDRIVFTLVVHQHGKVVAGKHGSPDLGPVSSVDNPGRARQRSWPGSSGRGSGRG